MFKFNFDKISHDFFKALLLCANNFHTNLYIVGGAVRDNVSNVIIKDYDLIIDGNALEFAKILPDSINVLSVHNDFATVKVEYKGMHFDIASTRTEKYPCSGCLPVIDKIGVDIFNDVKRRDFTVNTLYCRLFIKDNNIKFELIDIFNGRDDIEKKELKVLHSKSYIDDPTRILRGLGLCFRFGYHFSNADISLISDYIQDKINYTGLSKDRCKMVLLETLKIDPVSVFKEIIDKKYYKIIQTKDILPDIPDIINCIKLFNLSNYEQAQFLADIIEDKEYIVEDISDSLAIKKYFSKFKPSKLCYYYYKTKDSNVIKFLNIKNINILIDGDDLIKAGYKQGSLFSKIFNKLLEQKLSGNCLLTDKNKEMEFVKANFPIN